MVSAISNGDIPVDGNDCTGDVCTAGVPSNPALAAGTACNQPPGKLCDGTGVCVECLAGTDCASGVCTNHVCQAASCTDGVQNGTETGIDCGGSCPAACPAVVTITPSDGATGVPGSSTVAITFSTGMAPATLTAQLAPGTCTGSLQVSDDNFATCIGFAGAPVLSGGNAVATLTPAPGLADGTTYEVRVTATAADPKGNPCTTYTSSTGLTTSAPPASCVGSIVISSTTQGVMEVRPISTTSWSCTTGATPAWT